MSNRMKALYTIILPRTGDKPDMARVAEDVNQERLNDNFRTIVNELMKLWDGSEQNLKLLSARISADEQVFVTVPDAEGIAANAIANSAVILMLPSQIMGQVTEVLTGYATTQDVQDASDATLNAAQETTASAVNQLSNSVELNFSHITQVLGEQGVALTDLTSWVRVIGPSAYPGVNAGAIIGDSSHASSLKAESAVLFFYRGDDSESKPENADVLLDSDGRLIANNVHAASMLLEEKFDIDVVNAGGVDFLHITGRN